MHVNVATAYIVYYGSLLTHLVLANVWKVVEMK